MKKCRCRFAIRTAAIAAIPAPSTHLSTNRSAAGGVISSSASLSGRPRAARLAAASRCSVITSRTPNTTSTREPDRHAVAAQRPVPPGRGDHPAQPRHGQDDQQRQRKQAGELLPGCHGVGGSWNGFGLICAKPYPSRSRGPGDRIGVPAAPGFPELAGIDLYAAP